MMSNHILYFIACLHAFIRFHSTHIYRITFVVILISFNFIPIWAVPIESADSLVDEDKTLTSPIEFHLTSSDSPLVNSTISLNHVDAWLFFDNIKPSIVIDNHLSDIKINNQSVQVDGNARVTMYGHGTVVIPHGSTFKPLTVYNEKNFGGSSKEMAVHTYYKDLGGFDNSIQSFKLKRGYMATFANESDGSGYSRVFIADREDVVISEMPKELDSTVSFIRVFKHQWVSKKGWAGWDSTEREMVNSTCYYDWNVGGITTANIEYTPIRQHAGWPSWNDINAKEDVSHLLGFNEPDRPDQADMTMEEMLEIWPGMLNSGLRIGSPAWSNAFSGDFFEFIEICDERNYRVDFVALHCYWGGKSPINWYNDLKYIHDRTGRPLWITEWNNGANWTTESWPDNTPDLTDANAQKQLNDMKGILEVLDTAHFVERYFIYNWVEDRRAMIIDYELTPAGEYYASNKSEIAYNHENEVIPQWNYSAPELSLRYLRLSNSIALNWEDPNLELTKGILIEKKVNDGAYDTLYITNDISNSNYLDSLNPNIKGAITYRVNVKTVDGEYIPSNEVSYFQASGKDSIQTGQFKLQNSEWETALFGNSYVSEPLIILGVPSYENVYALTVRANNVTNRLFKFRLYPWNYLNEPVLSKKDDLAVISLPAGTYQFRDLQAEANAVSGLSRDWVTVTFDEPFDTSPVVFSSVVTNNNNFALTTAIRNITTTDFEICLKTEETIQASVNPEEINFLAIEPGEGIVSGNRITVGHTEAGNGISNAPVEYTIDETYTEPVIFANLLTSEEDYASTLRYSFSDDQTISFIRNRELSGVSSTVQEDQLGWMIMDIAPDQDTTQNTDNLSAKQFELLKPYPNPAIDYIKFNVPQPMQIQVFDLTGCKRIDTEAVNQLNVSMLPAGLYIIKSNEKMLGKFIKE